jgi:hypothetical protein
VPVGRRRVVDRSKQIQMPNDSGRDEVELLPQRSSDFGVAVNAGVSGWPRLLRSMRTADKWNCSACYTRSALDLATHLASPNRVTCWSPKMILPGGCGGKGDDGGMNSISVPFPRYRSANRSKSFRFAIAFRNKIARLRPSLSAVSQIALQLLV